MTKSWRPRSCPAGDSDWSFFDPNQIPDSYAAIIVDGHGDEQVDQNKGASFMSVRDKSDRNRDLSRRNILLAGSTLAAASAIAGNPVVAEAQQQPVAPSGKKQNILVIFGDDIGQSYVSAYTFGLMGYRTPNIDRIAKEGLMFTDYYAEQSCTAGRSSFITGQSVLRTGLSKVGVPGASVGLQPEDITIAEALKPLGYATGQFGKNHLGDRNEYLPTVHGFLRQPVSPQC
jgi:hypothetical protein